LVQDWLPAGPETTQGESRFASFLVALQLQRLAAGLALDTGDLPTARAWLAANDRWLTWSGVILEWSEGQLGWAAYYRAAGDLVQARTHAEAALAHASELRQPLALLAAHRILGELNTEAGRLAEASAHLDAALTLAEACAAPYERALTLLAHAERYTAEHQHGAAMSTLAKARAILETLKARPALARAETLAQRLTAASSVPAALPFGLSAREAEVLRLVAQGLPDAEIANRLFLSRRTVHAHLRTVYGKLGVASRSAATRCAIEHNLA
jgi:ATP/maltotriose-dependent transcriptional regulator MalT